LCKWKSLAQPANTRNNPVEDIESHLPLRVRCYELRTEAMGYGRRRGGLGAVREFELFAEGGVSIEGDGHRRRPWASTAARRVIQRHCR